MSSCLCVALPGPPTPKVTDWTKSTVDLEWIPPLIDGGSKVTGYFVEYINEEKEAEIEKQKAAEADKVVVVKQKKVKKIIFDEDGNEISESEEEEKVVVIKDGWEKVITFTQIISQKYSFSNTFDLNGTTW